MSFQSAKVWAVDLSPVAAGHAEFNSGLAGVSDHVEVVIGSWCAPLEAAGLRGRLGGLVSNPPYIPRVQMSGLQREVGAHEPTSALDGGEGPGMDSLAVICDQAVHMLIPGGFLALEVSGYELLRLNIVIELYRFCPQTAGKAQAEEVKSLLNSLRNASDGSLAFKDAKILQDCFGIERFVSATRW